MRPRTQALAVDGMACQGHLGREYNGPVMVEEVTITLAKGRTSGKWDQREGASGLHGRPANKPWSSAQGLALSLAQGSPVVHFLSYAAKLPSKDGAFHSES